MSNRDNLISVCVVVRNERDRIVRFLCDATQILSAEYQYYEILVVDNASNDGTDQAVKTALASISNLRLLRLSRVYDLDTAVTAALDSAIGDYVILIDLESKLDVIPKLLSKAEEGFDLVVVKRDLSRLYSPLDRWAAKGLYQFASRLLGYQVALEDGYVRLFSRRVVNALTQVRNRRRSLRQFGTLVGYRQASINAETGQRAGAVNRLEKIASIIDLVVNNSIAPLRFAALLGLGASALSLFYLVYIVVVTIVREGRLAEGWLTTSATTTTLFFFLFTILAILAEYIGRLLEESKDQPLYFVEFEDQSTVSCYTRTIEQEKLNIVQSQ